ncbi:MAG: hypothetical protein ACSHXK_12660 [Oceanococcus sp.]
MDYFEALVKTLLESEGYWVRQSLKVNLTKEEKREVANPSIPRPEIDLIAFKPGQNEVLAIEVKSYLDSNGVSLKEISQVHDEPPAKGRYKLLTCTKYRQVVFERLVQDLVQSGMVHKPVPVRLGLVAGKVHKGEEAELSAYLKGLGYFFWGPSDVRSRISAFADAAYENDPVVIAAKVLLRG